MANDIVNINGGTAELNVDVVISKGMDAQTNPVIAYSMLTGTAEAIIVVAGSLALPITNAELPLFYPNTPAGQFALRATF